MPCFKCWIVLVAPLIFHRCAIAEYDKDRSRVLIAYNSDTDPCVKVQSTSKYETKETARLTCLQAFHALDRMEGNSCDRWQNPDCRPVDGFNHFQCTCLMPASVYVESRNYDVIPFRECAWKLYTQEVLDGQAPTVSPDFKRRNQKFQDDAVESARIRRAASTSAEAGSSQVTKRQRTGGSYGGATSSYLGSYGSLILDAPSFSDTARSAGSTDTSVTPQSAQGAYECEVCGLQCPSKRVLKHHTRTHKPILQCNECDAMFTDPANINPHMKEFHPNIPRPKRATKPSVSKGDPSGTHTCEYCLGQYKTRRALVAHQKVHLMDVRCEACGASFGNTANLRRHKGQWHPELAEAEKAEKLAKEMMEKQHVCEICHARFAAKSTLNQHLAKHRGETTCDVCGATFARKTLLNQHKKEKHPEVG